MTEERRAPLRGNFRPQTTGRSLDDLGAQTLFLPVKVVNANIDLASTRCPYDIKCQSRTQQVWEVALPWPELPESAPELLEWFTAVLEKCASGATEGVESTPGLALEFPPQLHKSDRAKWHKLADEFDGPVRLTAVSEGVGEGRFLRVRQKAARRERRSVSERTRQIWKWCQEEGGVSWNISQGEVEDLLASGSPLPSNIQSIVDDRQQSVRLLNSIKGKDEATAVSIVDNCRKAAWVRSEDSGNYPIHEAIHQGLVLVVGRLSLMPGVLQQRDAKYRVPLALAQQLRRQDLIEVVSWAAA